DTERQKMDNRSEMVGVSGKLKVGFAIPTDNPKIWHLKNGSLTFENGWTVGIDVEGGYIPYFKRNDFLTVTYFVFRLLQKKEDGRVFGDVTMMTCVNGRVMEANDIADGVEVITPPGWTMAHANESL